MAQPTSTDAGGLSLDESSGRWVLAAMVLGSSLAFIDATVVSIALPAIGADLDAGLAGLAWTVNAYTLSLAALILLGGSLGDRLGRRRIFLVGVVWFACASLLCGIAPNLETLIAARALQGVGGALLTPGSLAILQSAYRPEDRARAIGAWSGLGGVAGAAGPFLGGWLVDVASWRWIFLINVPIAVAVGRDRDSLRPESRDPTASRHTDVVGAVLVAIGLGGLTYGLLAWPDAGLGPSRSGSRCWGRGRAGGVLRVGEPCPHADAAAGIFSSALFNATNLVTFVVYARWAGCSSGSCSPCRWSTGSRRWPPERHCSDHDRDARLVGARRSAGAARRASAAHDSRTAAGRCRRRRPGEDRRGLLVPGRCATRCHRARPRPGTDRGSADGHGARRGTDQPRRAGQRGQQRRRSRGRSDGGGHPARGGRAQR
jgi:MFS family permease